MENYSNLEGGMGKKISFFVMSSTVIKAIDQQLEGVGIIEKDDHGDTIMTWYVH